MSKEVWIAIAGLLTAILGVIDAWLSRKQEIIHRAMPASNILQSSATRLTVNQLMDELIRDRNLITYRVAYTVLMGVSPDPFSRTHVLELIRLAEKSKKVTVEGFAITLATLMVFYQDNEPIDAYFEGNSLTREEWKSIFKTWSVR